MKYNTPPPFEMTFKFNRGEDEALLEVSAYIGEFDETPTIEYVYNLETAKYVDIDNLNNALYTKFMNVVYDELTNDGGSYVEEKTEHYYYGHDDNGN